MVLPFALTPFHEYPQLTQVPSFKPGEGQNIASYASSTAKTISFVVSVTLSHSTFFSFSSILFQYKLTCSTNNGAEY